MFIIEFRKGVLVYLRITCLENTGFFQTTETLVADGGVESALRSTSLRRVSRPLPPPLANG